MSVTFISLMECKIGGTWVDITADVLANPGPRWNVGCMNNGPLDRVGDPENMTFYLNNSASCSGGVSGYYSPGHANAKVGWRTGLDVRLSFVYDGATIVKYYGTIIPEGIIPEMGIYGTRRVSVSCTGFMGRAAEHNINLLSIKENYTIIQAAQDILGNMPIQPTGTDYGTGSSTFTTVFDATSAGTKAVGEFQNLAVSELGYIFTKSDGTLVVRGRADLTGLSNTSIPKLSTDSGYLLNETGGYLLNETGGKIILDEVQSVSFDNNMLDGSSASHGKFLYNRIKTVSYPRKVDAAATTVLWTLQSAIEIPANSTKTGIRGAYRDPTGGSKSVRGKDMVTPVSGTDFVANSQSNGGGSNQTANMSVTAILGSSEAEFTITNSSGASIWTGGTAGTFQVRGKGVYFYDSASNIVEDVDSQENQNQGVRELVVDMRYQDNPTLTDQYANYLLSRLSTPRTLPDRIVLTANKDSASMMAFLYLEPGSRESFTETQSGISGNYFIMGYDAELIGGSIIKWYPVLVDVNDMDFSIYENGYPRITEDFTGSVPQAYIFGDYPASNGVTSAYWDSSEGRYYYAFSNGGAQDWFQYLKDDYLLSQGGLEVVWKIKTDATLFSYGRFGLIEALASDKGMYLYFDTTANTVTGKAKNVSTSTTATSYTYTDGTWYKAKLRINQAGTVATFYLYDNYDVLLWSDTLDNTNFVSSSTSLYPTLYVVPVAVGNFGYVRYFTAGFVHD